ncbi:unnamed protein product [Miscanthus lutarioriparius]|uniref:Peptidase A1 domain-containing protein n=1 Tax=Miscanthus lutarioriparius TaxID=422564 RepID=A0A811SMG8_9POAL|nr:unnamed protein product [Miscanthus lutarioriparius]CAD6342435.1 unnamed protein product [Miscanthus lutarioriparius]
MHKQLAVLLALLAALAIISCHAAAASAVRTQVIHTDAGRGLTRRELLQRMTRRSKARAARFLASSSSASAAVTPGQRNGSDPSTEYLVHLGIGTPPQPVQLTLDTGSDLTWTQCRPCTSCFHQALPYFDPSLSSTFQELSCGNETTCVYTYSYGDNSTTNGQLDAETFTFVAADGRTATAVPGLSFGCGHNNSGIFTSNETGIAGFGRGSLSLPSQLKVDNFSYCFTDITGSAPSPVLLGLPANLYSSAGGAVQTTPLIQSPKIPSFYYLSLKGITVGSTRLPVPESAFALTNTGTGGTIIDSGTSITTLPLQVYRLLRAAFVSQAKLPPAPAEASNATTDTDLICFVLPSSGDRPELPKLLFHFEGATLDLPRENYMFEMEDAGRSFTCLAINAGGDLIIIGNYQQQNIHVLYDLVNNRLSFVPAQCERL